MAYISFKPSDYYSTKLYTGNGSTNAITGVGFQPDFTWLKKRNAGEGHNLQDITRGPTKNIMTSSSNGEATNANKLQSFNSDGFTLGSNAEVNGSFNFASYNWKGSNTTATNTAGDVDSTVSVNTTAGISIVKWNNNTSNAISIGHGLGAIPDAVIVKKTDGTANWHCRFKGFDANNYISLNNTEAKGSSTGVFGTLPTSTLFYTGTSSYHINSNLVAYCFASKTGFSKIGGTYRGNGNVDGPFVYTGFRPAFLMIKCYSAVENWYMFDNKRAGYNFANYSFKANSTDAEATSTYLELLSNGFKIRNAAGDINANAEDFLYMAFAEQPIVGSNDTPGLAR